jgi:hypothetical protein
MADASKAAAAGPTKTEILLHLIIEELGGGSISYAAWGKIAEALSKTEDKPVTFNAARFRYSTFKKKMKAAGYDGEAGEADNEDEELLEKARQLKRKSHLQRESQRPLQKKYLRMRAMRAMALLMMMMRESREKTRKYCIRLSLMRHDVSQRIVPDGL